MLAVSTERRDHVAVVHASGEVDATTAHTLRSALSKAISEAGDNLVADLTEVTFMDSTGLGVLVGRLKEVRTRGGQLHCVVTTDRVRRVFMATGLDTVLQLHDDVDSAVSAITATSTAQA